MNKRLMELSKSLRLLGQEDGADEVTAAEIEKYDNLLDDGESMALRTFDALEAKRRLKSINGVRIAAMPNIN